MLYATDFHNGRVDVFDTSFKPVSLPDRPFQDRSLPYGFAPFGIQAINGDLYVSYARQDREREDDVSGRGLGYINVYDPNGRLLRRLVSSGALNAPWGMALAPASFGKFSNRLSNQPIDTLFFTSGPDDEKHGLYGRLDVAPGDEHDDMNEAE